MRKSDRVRELPSWHRRGGRDIKSDGAQPPLMERTGWSVTNHLGLPDHPVSGLLRQEETRLRPPFNRGSRSLFRKKAKSKVGLIKIRLHPYLRPVKTKRKASGHDENPRAGSQSSARPQSGTGAVTAFPRAGLTGSSSVRTVIATVLRE